MVGVRTDGMVAPRSHQVVRAFRGLVRKTEDHWTLIGAHHDKDPAESQGVSR
jgi:hypothetical protein